MAIYPPAILADILRLEMQIYRLIARVNHHRLSSRAVSYQVTGWQGERRSVHNERSTAPDVQAVDHRR